MRYPKGTIDARSAADRAVMEQILRSQFVTHEQLWLFLRDRCQEMSRDSFGWRVRRLVQHGLVREHRIAAVGPGKIYSLTAGGLCLVQNDGTFYADSPATAEKRSNNDPHIAHAIGLNRIHLRLLETGLLKHWTWEIEIRAINDFTVGGYRKDYDAIAELDLGGRSVQVALEYERSAKTRQAYEAIVEQLERESRVERFLYLVNGEMLRQFLLQVFRGRSSRRLYVGLVDDLCRTDPGNCGVVDAVTWEAATLNTIPAFEAALEARPRKQRELFREK